jgi:hypothetical protein
MLEDRHHGLARDPHSILGEHAAKWALYTHLWQAINLSPSRIAAIEKQVRDMQKNGFLKQRIHDCFDRMVKRWKADWAMPVLNVRSEDEEPVRAQKRYTGGKLV